MNRITANSNYEQIGSGLRHRLNMEMDDKRKEILSGFIEEYAKTPLFLVGDLKRGASPSIRARQIGARFDQQQRESGA